MSISKVDEAAVALPFNGSLKYSLPVGAVISRVLSAAICFHVVPPSKLR